jgi:hypothetical protein
VRAAAAAPTARSRDRNRRFGQILVRGLQYAITIECGHVEFLRLRGGHTYQRQNSQTQSQYRIPRSRHHDASHRCKSPPSATPGYSSNRIESGSAKFERRRGQIQKETSQPRRHTR